MDLLVLAVAFLVILAGAELFTNGIEWFGHKLQLAEGAVGSVLAAVGTALPETMIPLVAILVTGGPAGHAIGVGAILGAPFMLSTLAMFVTGAAVVAMAGRRPEGARMLVDPIPLTADLRVFVLTYALAVGAAFLPLEPVDIRPAVAIVLLVLYGWYVRNHFAAETALSEAGLAPLRLHRLDRNAHRANPRVPRLRIVTFQVLLGLGAIVVGAVAFVAAVEDLAHQLGVAEDLLALVIAPVATELPEKANSILWVRQGKDTLALGNITGAMVFQSAVPTSVALLFAPEHWSVSGSSGVVFASAAIALVSTVAIFAFSRRRGEVRAQRLLAGGGFYLLYLVLVAASLAWG